MSTPKAGAQVPLIIEPDPDDPDFAAVMVEAAIAGRPYRLLLDTGAARTQLNADEYTSALRPVGADTSSGSFGGSMTRPVVTVTDVKIGPLRLAALDVTRGGHGLGQVLGMDVLGRYCCHFRLAAGVMGLGRPPGTRADNTLLLGPRGHVYLEARWPGVSARACWDTGAGATVVDRAFWLGHPELFEQTGVSTGTDANGDQAETPVLLMTGPVIGQRTFGRHKVVAADLSLVNATLEHPMDLILGYPTIRQADWLFDFPARRWTVTS
jgi:Aspartyl protease